MLGVCIGRPTGTNLDFKEKSPSFGFWDCHVSLFSVVHSVKVSVRCGLSRLGRCRCCGGLTHPGLHPVRQKVFNGTKFAVLDLGLVRPPDPSGIVCESSAN